MMQLITPDRYGKFAEDLAEMYRLRYRVFKQRLDWDVEVSGDMELDAFDALHPAYLLQRAPDGRVRGCVRLLPTSGPTMLRDTFAPLLAGHPAPSDPAIWESSRFALDVGHEAGDPASGIASATYELFAGMIEFGLARGLADIVTVTDLRMERILRRAAWPLRRLGEPQTIGGMRSVAGYLGVSPEALAKMRQGGALRGPVLWAPVASAAA